MHAASERERGTFSFMVWHLEVTYALGSKLFVLKTLSLSLSVIFASCSDVESSTLDENETDESLDEESIPVSNSEPRSRKISAKRKVGEKERKP